MSLKSKHELLDVVRPRYLKANEIEKQKMLDEFTTATGYVFLHDKSHKYSNGRNHVLIVFFPAATTDLDPKE